MYERENKQTCRSINLAGHSNSTPRYMPSRNLCRLPTMRPEHSLRHLPNYLEVVQGLSAWNGGGRAGLHAVAPCAGAGVNAGAPCHGEQRQPDPGVRAPRFHMVGVSVESATRGS